MTYAFGEIDNCELMEVQEATLRSQDAQQTITFDAVPDSGNFTLTYSGQTTGNIAFDDAAADVEAALELLSNLTSVTVTGNFTTGFVVTFTGDDGAQDIVKMTATSALLDGADAVVISIEHTGRGYDNVGNYKQGVDSDTTIDANVQPLSGKEIEQLAEYDKERRHLYLWTKTALNTRQYIVYETDEFEISKVELWRGYYRALIIQKKDEQ